MSKDARQPVRLPADANRSPGRKLRMDASVRRNVVATILSVLCSLLLAAAILLCVGKSPLEAFSALFKGVFGSKLNFYQALATTTPLIFTGLAVAVAFRGGTFNIGAEGQLYVGGFASVICGLTLPLPTGVLLVVSLLAGAVAGALWALIPAILKIKWNGPEVVNTVMLNTIGVLLVDFFLKTYFQAEGSANETAAIQDAAVLPRVIPQSQLSYGILIAILMIALVYYLLKHTTLGYEIRTVGSNLDAARYAGISVNKISIVSMLLSGALAGLSGAVVCLGVYNRFIGGFSPGYGFDGIAVALLANNNPIGIFFSALLFGMLRTGGLAMDRVANVPVDVVDVILGLVVFFIAAPAIFEELFNWIERKKQAHNANKKEGV